MPAWPFEQAKARGSANRPVGEHDLELGEDHFPVLTPGMPVLGDPPGGQIEHPAQGIVVGKAGLVFGDLTELAVEALDDIGRMPCAGNFRAAGSLSGRSSPIGSARQEDDCRMLPLRIDLLVIVGQRPRKTDGLPAILQASIHIISHTAISLIRAIKLSKSICVMAPVSIRYR